MSTRQNDLIAHKLELRLENFTGEAAGHLPIVVCEFCGERPGGGADFPLVEAANFTDVLWKMDIKNLKPRTRSARCASSFGTQTSQLRHLEVTRKTPELFLVPLTLFCSKYLVA